VQNVFETGGADRSLFPVKSRSARLSGLDRPCGTQESEAISAQRKEEDCDCIESGPNDRFTPVCGRFFTTSKNLRNAGPGSTLPFNSAEFA